MVVVASGKEEAAGAVLAVIFAAVIFAATMLQHREQFPIGLVATHLEPLDDHAQMLLHQSFYEEDAMQMVRHYRRGQHLHFGMMAANVLPEAGHLFPQLR